MVNFCKYEKISNLRILDIFKGVVSQTHIFLCTFEYYWPFDLDFYFWPNFEKSKMLYHNNFIKGYKMGGGAV